MSQPREQALDLLRASRYTVVLTGAGVSTPSGIPDFRSDRSGLWTRADPLAVASLWAFHDHPEQFYSFFGPLIRKAVGARPNGAHVVLAQMEQMGWLRAVITQNIDSLHQRAGSRNVVELHGHTRSATCLECGYATESGPLWAAAIEGRRPPPCPQCRGSLKPDVVLFGEPLPYAALSAAQHEALACDVMLVVGTSLEVMPAADLPLLAKRRGARVIMVNLTPTPLDGHMDVVWRADVVSALEQIWRGLRRDRGSARGG